MTNKLYYGDNLDVLREQHRGRNRRPHLSRPAVQFERLLQCAVQGAGGHAAQAQIEAFEDTWHWNEQAERAFDEVLTGGHSDAPIMLKAMRSAFWARTT